MIKIDLSQEHPAVRKLFMQMLESEADGTAETIQSSPLEAEDYTRFLLFLIQLRDQLKEPALAVLDVPKVA